MIYLTWYMVLGVFMFLIAQLASMTIYRFKKRLKPSLVSPKYFVIAIKECLTDEFECNGADIYTLTGVVAFLLFWPVIIPIVFFKK